MDIASDLEGISQVGDSSSPWNGPDGQLPLYPYPGYPFYAPFILRITQDSDYVWHTFFGSDGNSTTSSLLLDDEDNIYVIGGGWDWWGPNGEYPLNEYNNEFNGNLYVSKWDDNGQYLWHTFYVGGSRSIILDTKDDIVVAGITTGTWDGPDGQEPLNPYLDADPSSFSGAQNVLVLKLDENGEYIWHTFYGGNASRGHSLVEGIDGNYIVAGRTKYLFKGPNGEDPIYSPSGDAWMCAFVLSLDPSGAYQWHTIYGGDDENTIIEAASHNIDKNGDIYVTGHTTRNWLGPDGQAPLNPAHDLSDDVNEQSPDIFVLKLNSQGEYLWHTFYGAEGPMDLSVLGDEGYYVTFNAYGDLYVLGCSSDPWDGPDGQPPINPHNGELTQDMVILSLNGDGDYLWHSFYGSPIGQDPFEEKDIPVSSVTDEFGDIFIAGASGRPWNGPAGQAPSNPHTGMQDVFILKLNDPAGNILF